MQVIGVVPAFNEAGRISATLSACLPYLDKIVVVDDGSTDATAQDAVMDKVVVLRHQINRGQGASLRTGTQAALKLGADIIVHLDADGQHHPEDIPTLIAPIVDGKEDVVFGSRFMGIEPEGMPFARRFLMVGIKLFNALMLGITKNMTDPQSGMRAMSASAAESIPFSQDRMAHASEILRLVTRSKLRWVEVPVHVRYTQDSLRKGQKSTDALKIVWQLFVGAFIR